jgi:hypothetical protein
VKMENNKLSGLFTNLMILTKNFRKISNMLRLKASKSVGKCRKASRTFESVGKRIRKLGSVAGPIGRPGGLGDSSEEAREVEVKCGMMGD